MYGSIHVTPRHIRETTFAVEDRNELLNGSKVVAVRLTSGNGRFEVALDFDSTADLDRLERAIADARGLLLAKQTRGAAA